MYYYKIIVFTKRLTGRKDLSALVRITGLEPAHHKILDPKSNASANSAISANIVAIIALLG